MLFFDLAVVSKVVVVLNLMDEHVVFGSSLVDSLDNVGEVCLQLTVEDGNSSYQLFLDLTRNEGLKDFILSGWRFEEHVVSFPVAVDVV